MSCSKNKKRKKSEEKQYTCKKCDASSDKKKNLCKPEKKK